MDSPTGPLTIPDENLVIEKDEETAIYGTGHNSVIKSHETDDWYIVYYRFNRPRGIEMGRSAGFHREVCIDKLQFDQDGNIIKTTPTLKGIKQNFNNVPICCRFVGPTYAQSKEFNNPLAEQRADPGYAK